LVVAAVLVWVWPRSEAPSEVSPLQSFGALDEVAALRFSAPVAVAGSDADSSSPQDAMEMDLVSYGEGCVVESASGDGGVEFRLSSGATFPQVGVVAAHRESGFVEVSVVVRSEVTDPGSMWTFRSMGGTAELGDGVVSFEPDGSGFSADLELVGVGLPDARLVGSASCR
jgi:hypothetical protein